jgi:uncharacterized membrane protein YhaH (DUF805 family)
MEWYLGVWKKFAEFKGRARRKEYWYFVLFNVIIQMVLSFIGRSISQNAYTILTSLYSLAIIIPTIAVGVRRMHDTEHSGWWLLVPIVNLVFALTEGTKGDNKYGPDPKAISETPSSITQ